MAVSRTARYLCGFEVNTHIQGWLAFDHESYFSVFVEFAA